MYLDFKIQLPHNKPEDSPHNHIMRGLTVAHLNRAEKMYLICNIGLAGGKITYCKSACMVVYQHTQEKERRREKLVRQQETTNHHKKQNTPT